MARVFAEYQSAGFSSGGQIYYTMRITIVEPETIRTEYADTTAVFDSMDDIDTISSKISDAIKAKADELGFVVNDGEIIGPGFMRI